MFVFLNTPQGSVCPAFVWRGNAEYVEAIEIPRFFDRRTTLRYIG